MPSKAKETERAATARFADELSAYDYLERIVWPDGVRCPHCRSQERIGKLQGASTRLGTYKCYRCRKLFNVTYGTILSASHVPLHKWLQAIYLTGGGARPMRPHHLQGILNVSFRTASSMMRRLTKAATRPPSGLVPGANPAQARSAPGRAVGRTPRPLPSARSDARPECVRPPNGPRRQGCT
jgi:transposase-like protein